MLPKKWNAKKEGTGEKRSLKLLTQGPTGCTKATCLSLPEQTFPDLSHAFTLFAVGVSFKQVTHGEGTSHCKRDSIIFHVINQGGHS